MRLLAFFIAWVALSAVVLAGDDKAPRKAKKPPPPPGIRWAQDLDAGRKKAMREGRPMLFAINALETESANNRLAQVSYQTATWGEATRGYVAFVCNPHDHMAGGDKNCTRYPGHLCGGHRAALAWFTKRFGESQISPQHVILEPDGDVAFRKEYYTGVVSPRLLETYLSKLAPRIAYSRAGIGRANEIKHLAQLPPEVMSARVEKWLDGSDGLAAAAIVNVVDDSYDAVVRRTLIHALRHTPRMQIPVLVHAAEERVLYPTDEPTETLMWIRTLFAADREAGVWAATRALVRLDDAAEREKVLRLWAGATDSATSPAIDDLPESERGHAYEALILAKDRRALVTRVPDAWKSLGAKRIARALRLVGRTTPATEALFGMLSADASPGKQRHALLTTTAEDIRLHEKSVRKLLATSLSERVRIAAALALLRAKLPQEGPVVRTILAAFADPIEGVEALERALAILGSDPGQSPEEWKRALETHLKGGAK